MSFALAQPIGFSTKEHSCFAVGYRRRHATKRWLSVYLVLRCCFFLVCLYVLVSIDGVNAFIVFEVTCRGVTNRMHRTKSLSDSLGELIVVRGYGRLWARQILEIAWNASIGEPYCHQTRVGEIRRGVLSVAVVHSSLLEELTAFRKASLLASLRTGALGAVICDIQFRVDSGVFSTKSFANLSLPAPVEATRSVRE